jgi:hypothetical protein
MTDSSFRSDSGVLAVVCRLDPQPRTPCLFLNACHAHTLSAPDGFQQLDTLDTTGSQGISDHLRRIKCIRNIKTQQKATFEDFVPR